MTRGRPLWFLGSVLAGWAGMRVIMLWPTALPLPILGAAPVGAAPTAAGARGADPLRPVPLPTVSASRADPLFRPSSPKAEATRVAPALIAAITDTTWTGGTGQVAATPDAVGGPGDPRPRAFSALVPRPSSARVTIDAWLVARPGGGDNLAFGQLGASQGGARLTYALDRGVALSGRVSAPLRGAGREIGVGIDLKPTRLPLHLLVEQRIDLDTGATRPAVIAIAGGSVALPWQAQVDAYAQAGGVQRRGGFVDAAAIVARSIVARGNTRLEVGAGAWGAAQRQVARLDVGPSLALVTPGGGGTLRLQLDYRARVAGHARPGSGPALTLGGSF